MLDSAMWKVVAGGKDGPTYDIFNKLNDAAPLWIETVDSLEHASQRLAGLSSKRSGTFMIFDARLGKFIEPLRSSARAGQNASNLF
jgi:hypothetical protein